jgi:glutamine amidotransferase
MCRMLGYVGEPVLLDELLIRPDNSLIHQTVNARMLAMLNLAGFGLAAWNDHMANPQLPLTFHSTNVAVFDSNLRTLAAKLPVRTLVAHLRGVPLDGTAVVNQQSLHPFHLAGSPLVLAHNGDLADFGRMRAPLLAHIHPDIARRMTALTDSAFLHALVLSQLPDTAGPFRADDLLAAVQAALAVVRQVRADLGIARSSSVNLIVSDGRHMVATRFTFDFGCFEVPPFQGGVAFLSLWYTLGARYGLHDGEWKMVGEGGAGTLVASEPLTRDVSTWVEVPEYHALVVDADAGPGRTRRRIVAIDA